MILVEDKGIPVLTRDEQALIRAFREMSAESAGTILRLSVRSAERNRLAVAPRLKLVKDCAS